jgi:hypothetical protein
LGEFSPNEQLFSLAIFDKCKSSKSFWDTFFHGESDVLILPKMDSATFWAIF